MKNFKIQKLFSFLFIFTILCGVFGLYTTTFSVGYYNTGPPAPGNYCVCFLGGSQGSSIVSGSQNYTSQQCGGVAKDVGKICTIKECKTSNQIAGVSVVTGSGDNALCGTESASLIIIEDSFFVYSKNNPLLLGENNPKKNLELQIIGDKKKCGDFNFSCEGCVDNVINYTSGKKDDSNITYKGITFEQIQAAKLGLFIDVTGEKIFQPTTDNLIGNVKITASNSCESSIHELYYKLEKPDCSIYKKNEGECTKHTICMWSNALKCVSKVDGAVCSKLSETECGISKACGWIKLSNQCTTVQDKAVTDKHIADYPVPDDYLGPIPTCAFSGTCRDVNQLIQLIVNFGTKVIFPVVAGLAFVFFVYGGFMMILSFGNSEKVQKGQQILVAAVVGLIIVFSAYMLIKFLLTALGVQQGFIGI